MNYLDQFVAREMYEERLKAAAAQRRAQKVQRLRKPPVVSPLRQWTARLLIGIGTRIQGPRPISPAPA
ncbi:MAG: hypothetical protein OXC13_14130 [Caldilineaceae bacterium]|nr:hypothetical protein [Caldilineaceae bacterium]